MSTSSPSGTAPHRRTALVVTTVVVVVALVVAAFLLLWGDSTGGNQAGPGVPPASPTTSSPAIPGMPPTTSPSESATTAPTTASPTSANALAELEAFFAAAARMDAQLRAAALKINGEGPPWPTFSEGAARAVLAADLRAVAEAVPGGMPEPLLASVMAVYHDLAARRAAMNDFASSWTYDSMRESPDSTMNTEALLAHLANGVAPAARFDADVATARERATSTARFTRARFGSRGDMETYLYLEMVMKGNFGCNAHGGPDPLTHLPPIVWTSESTGTIGDELGAVEFEIRVEPDGTYTEDPIHVC
jgi:hypothetical protein